MIEVKIFESDVGKVLEIVHELRKQGLVIGNDFDFTYHPSKYDNDGWQPVHPKHTVFTFYEEKWATWFSLKYSNK